MTNPQIPEDVLKRLNKLLNLAEGAKAVGSLAEAENAAARAQQILMQYNLSEEDARAFGTTKAPITEDRIETSEMTSGKEGDWIPTLYHHIAKNNLCFVLMTRSHKKGGGKDIILFGTEANRQVVEYFASYLIPLIRNLARKAFSEYLGEEKRGAFIRGFLTGCVQSIGQRLSTTVEQMSQQDSKITGLIRVSGQEIKQYLDNSAYRVRTSRSMTKRSARGGLEMGREAGKSISLNKGVNGGSTFNKGLLS